VFLELTIGNQLGPPPLLPKSQQGDHQMFIVRETERERTHLNPSQLFDVQQLFLIQRGDNLGETERERVGETESKQAMRKDIIETLTLPKASVPPKA
jgi:hypothetical protein